MHHSDNLLLYLSIDQQEPQKHLFNEIVTYLCLERHCISFSSSRCVILCILYRIRISYLYLMPQLLGSFCRLWRLRDPMLKFVEHENESSGLLKMTLSWTTLTTIRVSGDCYPSHKNCVMSNSASMPPVLLLNLYLWQLSKSNICIKHVLRAKKACLFLQVVCFKCLFHNAKQSILQQEHNRDNVIDVCIVTSHHPCHLLKWWQYNACIRYHQPLAWSK